MPVPVPVPVLALVPVLVPVPVPVLARLARLAGGAATAASLSLLLTSEGYSTCTCRTLTLWCQTVLMCNDRVKLPLLHINTVSYLSRRDCTYIRWAGVPGKVPGWVPGTWYLAASGGAGFPIITTWYRTW